MSTKCCYCSLIITSVTKNISSNRAAFSQSQFNADLCHKSINIAAETNPRSQSNDISHFKGHYVMKPICGR